MRFKIIKSLFEKMTGQTSNARNFGELQAEINASSGGGGGGTVYFDAIVDGGTVTSDKTPQEVENLLKQGSNVICRVKMPDMYEDLEFPCTCLLIGTGVAVAGGNTSNIYPMMSGSTLEGNEWSIRLA